MSGKRISLELPEELVDQIDQLRKDWKTRSRGECLRRLLEEIFQPDTDQDAPSRSLTEQSDQAIDEQSPSEADTSSSPTHVSEPAHQPQYDED